MSFSSLAPSLIKCVLRNFGVKRTVIHFSLFYECHCTIHKYVLSSRIPKLLFFLPLNYHDVTVSFCFQGTVGTSAQHLWTLLYPGENTPEWSTQTGLNKVHRKQLP